MPFRQGEEVHVDIVEPHMYSEDDAVAKVDGYLIEVRDGIEYVGEKVLVRIEEAGRTSARAVLAEVAEEAAAATEERRKARERSAKRAATTARSRKKAEPKPATPEDEAVSAHGRRRPVHAGTGPAAAAEADEDAAKPHGPPALAGRRPRRRRSLAEAEGGAEVAAGAPEDDAEPEAPDAEGGENGDDAVQSKPRRRGRRGGRRRSRAKAESDAAEVSDASE